MEDKASQDIKILWAFRFWYKSTEMCPTQYCYVFAYSYKQALYYWNKHYQSHGFDWGLDTAIHPLMQKKKHRPGEFWTGINARI